MMNSRQIDFDALPAGTYLYTGHAASRGLTINRLCYELKDPANREAYKADPEAVFDRYRLDPELRDLIRENDWLGLIKAGANAFALMRLSALHGFGLAGTGAQMRGETLEQYLATREAKGS